MSVPPVYLPTADFWPLLCHQTHVPSATSALYSPVAATWPLSCQKVNVPAFLPYSYAPSISGLPLAYHAFMEPCRKSSPSAPYLAVRTAQKSSGVVSIVLAARYMISDFFACCEPG